MYTPSTVPSTPAYCSQLPYKAFLPLRNFEPAVKFCTTYLAQNKKPSVADCPKGSALCATLAKLSKCDPFLVAKTCTCIGAAPPTVSECKDGSRAVTPTPPGLTCQRRGRLTTPDGMEGDPATTAASVNDCGRQCLDNWYCYVSEYTPDDGMCQYYFNSAADEGFVPDPTSRFIYSDMGCFERC